MGEEQVVLEHDADGPLLGGDEHARRPGSSTTLVVDGQATGVDGLQPGQGAEHGRLAGAVGTEEGHDLAGVDGEVDVEVERPEVEAQRGGGGHDRSSQRSRSETITTSDTASSTRLMATATSGLASRAR